MILAIDIGNTNIVVGCIDKEKYILQSVSLRFGQRQNWNMPLILRQSLIFIISTVQILKEQSFHRLFHRLHCCQTGSAEILKKDAMIVGPGVKTGLNILLDNPGEMGADRVADAVAALAQYPVPLVIIDMGTATTISVVDDKKHYIGGMIMPGVQISLDALTSRASQLSGISIEEPKKIIGKNTVDCMKSGILYGNAAALDGIIDRIEEELGQKVTVIATGGMSRKIIPHCKRKMILDGDLLLKGLQIIYDKNK